MFLKVRVIISESFMQKYQSQGQLLNLKTQSDVFFGPPCTYYPELIQVGSKIGTLKCEVSIVPETNSQ